MMILIYPRKFIFPLCWCHPFIWCHPGRSGLPTSPLNATVCYVTTDMASGFDRIFM